MISDETFPDELQIEDENVKFNEDSSENLISSYFSAEDTNNQESSVGNSINIERLIRSTDLTKLTHLEYPAQQNSEISFDSLIESSQKFKAPAPRAPIKKKKSLSCQNLASRKNSANYDHVESKVRKLIENLRDDRNEKKKPFLRTKSGVSYGFYLINSILNGSTYQPICAMQASPIDIDERNGEEFNKGLQDLRRELRQKSLKIYELEAMVEEKDENILSLQCERARMKMTFDDFRKEMDQLRQENKEIRKQFKLNKALDKTQKSVLIQTEHERDESRQHLLADSSERTLFKSANYDFQPAVRHLTFSEVSASANISSIDNTSSDNLIPFESDIIADVGEDSVNRTNETSSSTTTTATADETGKKKKKKKFRFFKLMQCISGKS